MKGKLFGIGVGPGDPELLTLKAVRVLGQVDAVIVPCAAPGRRSIAYDIVMRHIPAGTAVVELVFPMAPPGPDRDDAISHNVAAIRALLDDGKNAALVTLGDPGLYSTFSYVAGALAGDYVIEIVPGITSWSAAAGALGIPLVQNEEMLGIVPLHEGCDVALQMERLDTAVFMKVSADAERLADFLKKNNNSFDVYVAAKCGMDGERLSRGLDELHDSVPYLTTVIVKRKK